MYQRFGIRIYKMHTSIAHTITSLTSVWCFLTSDDTKAGSKWLIAWQSVFVIKAFQLLSLTSFLEGARDRKANNIYSVFQEGIKIILAPGFCFFFFFDGNPNLLFCFLLCSNKSHELSTADHCLNLTVALDFNKPFGVLLRQLSNLKGHCGQYIYTTKIRMFSSV